MIYQQLETHEMEQGKGGSVTFEVNPPMLFHAVGSDSDRPTPGVSRRSFNQFKYVTVCSFDRGEEFPYGRTVIHATEKLRGGDGFCYGGQGAWVLDGCSSPWDAMRSFGYLDAEEPLRSNPSRTESPEFA